MSLADLNTKETADNGVEIEILHPGTNLPVGVAITVLGTDSAAFRAITRKQRNRRLESMNRSKGKVTQTDEEQEAEALDILAACTKSWRTGENNEIEVTPGEFLACTPENAKRLYADVGFSWLREQVDREIGDRTNFLKG